MNELLKSLKKDTNYTFTENGAITHKSTLDSLLDLFAFGGAYRNRSDDDCITLFKKAFAEDETLAMKCLFYLRDARGGMGERRFFRTVMRWLACEHEDTVRRNLAYVPTYGRWDDFYTFVGTPLENDAFNFMHLQLLIDSQCETPSLLAKWLKSENASSAETRQLATITREHFGMTPRQYRKTLSALREKIKVVEVLMSEGRWNEIQFDKLPSKAGLIYKNAFAKNDYTKERYAAFAQNKETKVNAGTLYPYDIAEKAFACACTDFNNPDRLMLQKYWDNLPNYYGDHEENGLAIVDVSGSMTGRPMAAAVSLGAYVAEKAHGPFANHFITFSNDPQLVEFEGVDIVDKFRNCRDSEWGMSTNIEATLDMLLSTAIDNNIAQEDMPTRLYIFSDMEFNAGLVCGSRNKDRMNWWREITWLDDESKVDTLFESIEKRWNDYGYELPDVIFWNLNAMQDNVPAMGKKFNYVSGCSPTLIECILSGKTGYDLMLEKLNSERYEVIR